MSRLGNQKTLSFEFKVKQAVERNNNYEEGQPKTSDRNLEVDRAGVKYKTAVFSKTMPHNSRGEVLVTDWDKLATAAVEGTEEAFSVVAKGSTRKFVNPRSAHSFYPMGVDAFGATMPAPHEMQSREASSEMLEVYEQALNRDTPFYVLEDLAANTDADRAVASLNAFGVDFLGPKDTGSVTRKTLFRGAAQGCVLGPYISQFLYYDVPYGAGVVEQKYNTEAVVSHGTILADYLAIQNGDIFNPNLDLTGNFNYIHDARVLGSYVHRDGAFQAYINAAFILCLKGAPFDTLNPYIGNDREESFLTHGPVDVLLAVTSVANVALRAAWCQKWTKHLRMRPEVMACRVHHQDIVDTDYGLHADLMSSPTIAAVKAANASGTALLPLQYPEGSPAHPSYPAGHAVFSGACITVLKAFFKEETVITSLFPVLHSETGASLDAYTGSTTGMTVGTELNKLGANITIGRDWAGVHYRSDGDWGMNLGEKVAIQFLKDLKAGYNEEFAGWNLTKFDGTVTVI